jgi:hypothetical protein
VKFPLPPDERSRDAIPRPRLQIESRAMPAMRVERSTRLGIGAASSVLALLLIAATPALVSAGEKRYVVDNTVRGSEAWPLWTSQLARDACSRALREGTKKEREELCDTDVSGLKPMLGSLPHGAEVELLDARGNCGQMVTVRVLSGPLQGETGCIAGNALSRVKPK